MACHRRRRRLLIACTTLFVAYVASYLTMTIQGRFEARAWHVGYVDQYEWAPRGFVRDYQWNVNLMRLYGPLYALDVNFWHVRREANGGKYPIHVPSDEEQMRVIR